MRSVLSNTPTITKDYVVDTSGLLLQAKIGLSTKNLLDGEKE
jgi:hypothetical protein